MYKLIYLAVIPLLVSYSLAAISEFEENENHINNSGYSSDVEKSNESSALSEHAQENDTSLEGNGLINPEPRLIYDENTASKKTKKIFKEIKRGFLPTHYDAIENTFFKLSCNSLAIYSANQNVCLVSIDSLGDLYLDDDEINNACLLLSCRSGVTLGSDISLDNEGEYTCLVLINSLGDLSTKVKNYNKSRKKDKAKIRQRNRDMKVAIRAGIEQASVVWDDN
jgi:hypothetical protein